MKILAIERRRDVKAAIYEHRGDPAQCLAIGYTQGNVVCDARAGVTRPVGRSAKKIDGDRAVRGANEEAEHRAFLPKLFKTQSLRQKLRRVPKPFDLNLNGSNPPNCLIGWLFPVLIIRACFPGFLDQSQFETIGVPETQTLLSERPGVADHVCASLHQAIAPTRQCSGRHRKNNGADVTRPTTTGRLGFMHEERDHGAWRASAVSKIEVEHRWLVKIHRLPDKMKAKCAGVKLLRPLRIGGDGSDMVNATDCHQGWLRF
jgi:hypothetical protein